MGWLVGSTVVIAALQRAVDTAGKPTFVLKGGTLLQHRLGMVAHRHWPDDYARAAADGGVLLPLDEAVAVVNDWLAEIAASE